MRRTLLRIALLAALPCATPRAAPPVLTEFLADNETGITDEDGERVDWIEILNPGPGAVDLAGHRLTDDAGNPLKWVFPSRVLGAGERLVVFASNKDRAPLAPANLHTDFKLSSDGGYLALLDPSGTVLTSFTYPRQDRDISYGNGYAGAITPLDLTPTALEPGMNYNRVSLTGSGTADTDESLNSYDDGQPGSGRQHYLWYNYAARLAEIPPGHTVLSATLSWEGAARVTAGVSGLGCVPATLGIYPCPDGNRGIPTLAGGTVTDLVAYAATHLPAASSFSDPGHTDTHAWDVTALVSTWRAAPTAPQTGQFLILNSAQPHWVAWDQHQRGPTLAVRTTANATPLAGFMAPTPGADNSGATPAGPLLSDWLANPPAPVAGQPFTVTIRAAPFQGGAIATATLLYRRHYDAEQSLALVDDGTNGDAVALDGVYTGQIPAAAVQAGHMLRWAFRFVDAAGHSTREPAYRFPTDSPQYLGTVPVDPTINTSLSVLHWFAQDPNAAAQLTGSRASLYYLGEFYDNVFMNLHGQSTAGPQFVKKSYNIDFNRRHRFRWDPAGQAPRVKDINLLTNYGDKTKMRHVLAYQVFRDSGTPAHFCQTLRVQRNGAFNGLYDLVEDGDGQFLERTGLNPLGALYKMANNLTDVGGDHSVTGVEKKNRETETNADLRAFLDGLNQTNLAARRLFLYDNLDLPRMINFMAANTVTANIDLHSKNYYVYRDTGRTGEWTLLPWDLDLSFGRLWTPVNNYFDDGLYENPIGMGLLSGRGNGLVDKLYNIPEFADMARRRFRTLHDRFLQPNTTLRAERWLETRFAELETVLGNDALLDYTLYQPSPAWMNPGVATESPFRYNTVAQELARLRSPAEPDDTNSYLYKRRAYVYGDGNTVAAQNTNAPPAVAFGTIEVSPASGDQDQEYIELVNTNVVAVDLSDWRLDTAVDFTFLPGTVIPPGASLFVSPDASRFRARTVSPKAGEGRFVTGPYQGHLSNLGETIRLLDAGGAVRASTVLPASPTDAQRFLVVSEILYQPDGDGLAEFLELRNISTNTTLSLAGIRFTAGVEFDFTGTAITSLAPGEQVLVVRDAAAFALRFGPGLPVAGVFTNSTSLSNGGETLKLEDAQGNTIAEFTYDDAAPWPVLADAFHSLVLMRPELDPITHPLSEPTRWRASLLPGGTPGGAGDEIRFTGDPLADGDGDGIRRLMEYVQGTSDTTANPGALFTVHPQPSGGVWIEVLVHPGADDALWSIESSPTLSPAAWQPASATLISDLRQPSGLARQTWSIPAAPEPVLRTYLRLRAELR